VYAGLRPLSRGFDAATTTTYRCSSPFIRPRSRCN
jgi:hypothetical protein